MPMPAAFVGLTASPNVTFDEVVVPRVDSSMMTLPVDTFDFHHLQPVTFFSNAWLRIPSTPSGALLIIALDSGSPVQGRVRVRSIK